MLSDHMMKYAAIFMNLVKMDDVFNIWLMHQAYNFHVPHDKFKNNADYIFSARYSLVKNLWSWQFINKIYGTGTSLHNHIHNILSRVLPWSKRYIINVIHNKSFKIKIVWLPLTCISSPSQNTLMILRGNSKPKLPISITCFIDCVNIHARFVSTFFFQAEGYGTFMFTYWVLIFVF